MLTKFSELTAEQKAIYVLGFMDSQACAGILNEVFQHGTADEKERMVQDLLLKNQMEQQQISDQVAENVIKAMVAASDNEGDCGLFNAIEALRSMLRNASNCGDDGGIYVNGKRVDSPTYVIPEGVTVPVWPAYIAVSNDGESTLDSIGYEALSDEEKKKYTKRPCISFEYEGEVIRITFKDRSYITRLIALDIQRNPGVRFLYASKVGAAKEPNFTLFDSAIIEALRGLSSIIWNDAVVNQVENAEVGSVAQIYLAILDSLDSMSDISQLKAKDVEECLPILEEIVKNPKIFTDEDIMEYRNNGQEFPGYIRNTTRRDNVTVIEQRTYITVATRNVVNKLFRVTNAEENDAYDTSSILNRLCKMVTSMPASNK